MELEDYSCDFRPDLKLDDFSKDALKRLAVANAKCYLTMDGLWYSLVEERFGTQAAREMEKEIWENRALPREARQVCSAMNIRGDDVATLFKLFQVQPAFVGDGYEIDYNLKDRNHGIVTVNRCLFMDYCERHQLAYDWARFVCEVVDDLGFKAAAHYFNPNMTVTPLKLPPGISKDERPQCIWEYKVE